MKSVPGAIAIGFSTVASGEMATPNPVATAPGTDLIMPIGAYVEWFNAYPDLMISNLKSQI